MLDELGFGLAQNFVQVKSVRDAAKMLDCLAVPQPGDPFVVPRPRDTLRLPSGGPRHSGSAGRPMRSWA
jgi:hypothetical protein